MLIAPPDIPGPNMHLRAPGNSTPVDHPHNAVGDGCKTARYGVVEYCMV